MDLKTGDSNNKASIDSEKGAFERFETELKNTIFGVLFLVLKDDEMSMVLAFIISLIQFLQILCFPFHSTVMALWSSDTIADGIRKAVGYLRFVQYFENTNFNVYIIIFYVLCAIILFVILDVIYVSVAFSKKKYAFSWPVSALKIIIWLFSTVLYLPIIDYFFSILNCVTDVNGDYVHYIFSEQTCWSGIYILHAIIAIFMAIIFTLIALTSALTFFECRTVSNDPTSRVNSRANGLFILYELVLTICFTFMNTSDFHYVLLAITFAGSIILFMKFHFNSPYYNEVISKLWSALMSINLWTAIMLIFSKIMQNTLFEGSIIAWFIGIPFIILIVITNRDHRIDLLLINVNKFQSGEEIQNQIRYLLKLLQWQTTNRNAAILIDGYIEIHKQTCAKDDCPLKQKVIKNTRLTKSLISNDETLNEKYALLIQLFYKMFFHGIKKFPSNSSLRIAYAFFLLDKMGSRQQALQELSNAEQTKPPFDEQFIIYRYKKIIEDEIAESQNEGQGGLDVVSELAFQNHLRNCQANIEKSALLHMEFWSQLSEDNPDLGKLNEIGSKINSSVQYVEEHWNKLQKINHNNTKAMRLYGKFLIEIINDKEGGEALLERARNIMNVNSNKKNMMINPGAGDDYANDATPTVYVASEQDKFANITGINLAAASLFGYNKTELINRKVNVLMPQLYSKIHDSFIDNYLNNSGEGVLIGKNKEKLVFGKNKSNYIFPVYLSLRAVPTVLQGVQFIANFRVEKNFKNAAYVLTDGQGNIDSISSSCISILKIDIKLIMQKKSNIQDFIPQIVKERSSIFTSTAANTKSFATVNFSIPKDSEYLMDSQEYNLSLNCFLFEMVFLNGKENVGFQFRFEKPMDKNPITNYSNWDKKAQISNFQFRYERGKAVVIGEYAETTSDNQSGPMEQDNPQEMLGSAVRSDIDHENEENMNNSNINPFASAKNKDIEIAPRKKYGEGIKTLRLLNGRPVEIEEDKDEEGEEGGDDAEGGNKQKKEEKEQQKVEAADDNQDDYFRDFNSTFKSRKALNSVISDRRPPQAIRNLKWTANILMLVMSIIAIINYVIEVNQFNNILDNITLINDANLITAEFMNVLSKTRDLYLANIGITFNPDVHYMLEEIQVSLQNIQQLKISMEASSLSLSSAHYALYNDASIPLVDQNGQADHKGLGQAIDQLISKAFQISKKNLPNITISDPDYYFLTYNLLNEFYMATVTSANLYVDELVDRTDTETSVFLTILIVSALCLILTLIILFPVLFNVNKTREEVLSLFLDIPEKTVKSLYQKCENFISNLQVGEDDDVVSEIDEEEMNKQNEDENLHEYTPKRKKRKFKNSGKSQRKVFLQFLVGAIAIEGYFIYAYFDAKNALDNLNAIIPEMVNTASAEAFYSFVNNAERQLFIDPTFHVIANSTPILVATDNIKAMYSLDSQIHQDHSINIDVHSALYVDTFNNIMMLNPCGLLAPHGINETACQIFADGAVYQGMAVDLTRHFENLRFLLTLFTRYNAGNPWDQDTSLNTTISLSATSIQKNLLYIARTPQAIEVDTTQHEYIKYSFRILMTNFITGMRSTFDSNQTTRLIVFIFFLIALFAIYVVFWLPLISKLANDIWRTKSMLSMIPLNVIARIKNVRIYLRKFWNTRSSDY